MANLPKILASFQINNPDIQLMFKMSSDKQNNKSYDLWLLPEEVFESSEIVLKRTERELEEATIK